MVIRSKCKHDPLGYCGTKAEVYLWEKRKGSVVDFVTNQIMHRIASENTTPFIILLGDADHKGIYTIEGSGNDAGGPSSVNLVFIPYKGKCISSLIPDSLFSLNKESKVQKSLIQ